MTGGSSRTPGRTVDVRVLLVTFWVLLALAAAFAFLWLRAERWRGPSSADALRDPGLRRELLDRLAGQGTSDYDSHPDPEVGHVALTGSRKSGGVELRVNAYGMREREYALPKPTGTTRVVLLGDSFVYGLKAPQDVRLGVHLERMLKESCRTPGAEIEVLHVAIPGWSLTSECAYLRRQLHELRPDLVLHVTCSNDLDDVSGVRGFGAFATFAPAHPESGDGMLYSNSPFLTFGHEAGNRICSALEYEGQRRFSRAREAVLDLRADLARAEGSPRYVMVVYWQALSRVFHQQLGRFLDPAELLYIPREIFEDQSSLIPGDGHWSAAGHERIARLLFATILARELLPQLSLEGAPELVQEGNRLAEQGMRLAQEVRREGKLAPVIEARQVDERTSRLILGGLDPEGRISPCAAFTLGQPLLATVLRLRGRYLPDRVLAGKSVRVFVEEFELGSLVIRPDEEFEAEYPLPDGVRGRKNLSVRLTSEDYVYRGPELRHCVVLGLERVAIE